MRGPASHSSRHRVRQLADRVERLDVEIGAVGEIHDDALRVAGDRPDPLLRADGVGVEQRAVAAHDDGIARRLPGRVVLGVPPRAGRRIAGERADRGAAEPPDHVHERQPRRDDEALQHPERQHADQRQQREDERADADPAEPGQLVRAQEPGDRDDHDRGQRRLRKVLEQRREERAREEDQRAGDQRGELGLAARPLGRGGLARAARLDEPRRQAREQVGAAERDQIAVADRPCSRAAWPASAPRRPPRR